MMLAGIPVPDGDLLELSRLVADAGSQETAERLERAWNLETKMLGLTIEDREAILRGIERASDEAEARLAELRAVLLAEHVGPLRQGLA